MGIAPANPAVIAVVPAIVTTIYITPDNRHACEKLELTIVYVIGAIYRPLGAHDPMQPGCDVRVLGKYTIDMKAEAQTDNTGISDKDIKKLEKINYTDYELSQLIKTYSDGSIENQLETVNFRNTYTQSIIENGRLHLFTEFGGAGKGEYIIMKKKVIVACGGAVATSTIAANAIVELAKENNIDIEIAQVRISEIASNLPADLIVTTSKVKRDFGVPLITGMPFVSGLGVDKTKAKILEVLNK